MGCKVALGEICSFSRGASIPRARMLDRGDYLYIHYGDLYKGFDVRIDVEDPQKPIPYIADSESIRKGQWLRDQDIVYVLTSETVEDLGHAFLFSNPKELPAVAGTETTVVRVNRPDLLLPSYLNWLFQSARFKQLLRQYVKGMKVFRVHPDDLARIQIEMPPIDDQRRIVSILNAIFERSLINNQINGYLAALLDAKFEKLLENVDGWGEASLLDIANYKNGLAMQKFRPKAGDPGLPVLKIRELGQGCCGPDSERCQSDIDEAVAVHDGDLVFSWSGTLLLDFWAGGDAGLNQHLFKVTSVAYPSWFYYMWTKYHLRKFIAMAKDRATTMGHIKRSALADSKVLIPERPILEELTESMQPIVDQVILNKVENRKLGSLRDVLLPKLMSGEIDVSKVNLTQLNSHLAGC